MSKQTKNTKKSTAALRKNCKGLCCRYFALPIEPPQDWDDYDDIRWYLAHENVTVFVEDGDWYLNVKNKCRYLSEKDYSCQTYDKRPNICRQYNPGNSDFTNTNTIMNYILTMIFRWKFTCGLNFYKKQ